MGQELSNGKRKINRNRWSTTYKFTWYHFQAGKDDTLEFIPIVEGDAGIYSTGVYVDNQPKCFINWSNTQYKDTDVTYFDSVNSKEYTFKLTNSNIHLN